MMKKPNTSRKLPYHVAIIMDGNGRWASKKGLERVKGHEKGTDAVKAAVEQCRKLEIPYLTLYAFSTENWSRPKLEVNTLMRLLVASLKREIDTLQKNNIKLISIGNQDALPNKVQKQLNQVKEATLNNSAMTLCLALNYGSREELTQACKKIAQKVKTNQISPEQIGEFTINEHLYTAEMPEVDLVIRTSGEIRISNFLLWQIAYAELHFTEVLWPEFTADDFNIAIADYQKRERRF
ncbi:MAG: isoprenyl transferase, partial [Flavobacteriaceae bacterium]|nr:isoprenyl transferase [Flavobacteriaceae bacterium]